MTSDRKEKTKARPNIELWKEEKFANASRISVLFPSLINIYFYYVSCEINYITNQISFEF